MTELVFAGTAGALLGVGWLLERVVAGPAAVAKVRQEKLSNR